jgi:N-acetylgalactosamine kinase
MGSADLPKVCFPLHGRPAICRQLDALKRAGLTRFVLVVGHRAEKVIQTVEADHPGALYAYQSEPLGTGHAAQCGFNALHAIGHDGPILITMGDKLVSPPVVKDLIDRFVRGSEDLTMVGLPKKAYPDQGRVVTDRKRRIVGVFEVRDLKESPSSRLTVGGKKRTLAQLERTTRYGNASVYLARSEPLYEFLPLIKPNNVQKEYYLTDLVGLLASALKPNGEARFRLGLLPVDDATQVMTYNTPAELLKIESHLRRLPKRTEKLRLRLPQKQYKPAGKWLAMLQSPSPALRRAFRRDYGADEILIEQRRRLMESVVKLFVRRFGHDRDIILVRAPGRVNLMGRHVDHRGGFVNPLAIDREVVFAAAPRTDDRIVLTNTDHRQFPDREFSIGDLLGGLEWNDWLSYVDSPRVVRMVRQAGGDWSNYVKAAVLRLQQKYHDIQVRGMDCAVGGDVPMAAGLSSSSAVVVASAQAAVALNGFAVEPQEFVDLCGEGEWFVGSRGGQADHAAIHMGRRGQIARIGFRPFRVDRLFEFPTGYALIIANSYVRATKSSGARDRFNQKVGCYEFGLRLLKRRNPTAAGVRHLRELDPDTLGLTQSQILEMLLKLPVRVKRRELRTLLTDEDPQELERIFSSHADIGPYDLRGAVAFGIAECRRSRVAADVLEAGHIEEFGRLMNFSHDGDRVSRLKGKKRIRWQWPCENDAIQRRCEDLRSEHPDRVRQAQLSYMPGAYGCSTPEIDTLVDLAQNAPGVVGAQLAGAGLGGCAMILAHANVVDKIKHILTAGYYRPNRLKPDVHVCIPVAGSRLLEA